MGNKNKIRDWHEDAERWTIRKELEEKEVGKMRSKSTKILDGMLEIAEKGMKALPPVQVMMPKIVKKKGDEEEMFLCLSDLQVGHKTKTYNSEIFRGRIENLYIAIKTILNLHKHLYPIRTLNVFGLGDFVQGDLISRFVDLDELESPVIDQFFHACVPAVSDFLVSLTQNFEKVKFYGVRGNHGVIHKFASARTNWDYIIYKMIESRLAKQPRLEFHISDSFYHVAKIQGWKFFLIHGDQIPMYLSLPLNS